MARNRENAHDPLEARVLSGAEVDPTVVELPDRVALSLANINLAAPINVAAALNVLSDNSAAGAFATQQTPILQTTGPFMGQ